MNVAQNVLVSGTDAARWGNSHPNLVPYQLFHAADRPIVVAVGSDPQWRALVRALDLSELAADPALDTNAGRLAARARVTAALSARLATRDAAHWRARLDAAGVPCGQVRGVLDALRDVRADAATGVAPSVPGTVRRPPPRLDEHGASVREKGWEAFV